MQEPGSRSTGPLKFISFACHERDGLLGDISFYPLGKINGIHRPGVWTLDRTRAYSLPDCGLEEQRQAVPEAATRRSIDVTVRVRLTRHLPNPFVDGPAVQNGVLRIAIPVDHRLHRVGIFTSKL